MSTTVRASVETGDPSQRPTTEAQKYKFEYTGGRKRHVNDLIDCIVPRKSNRPVPHGTIKTQKRQPITWWNPLTYFNGLQPDDHDKPKPKRKAQKVQQVYSVERWERS